MVSTMGFIPVLAAVCTLFLPELGAREADVVILVTFVTYGLSGHPLNPSIIFSGLQYFNVLKQPISFLPMAFTAVSDAAVAVG
jgi:hypothetical protein